MGLTNQQGTSMGNTAANTTTTVRRPAPPRPAGEQAIGSALYAQIRQAIAELK